VSDLVIRRYEARDHDTVWWLHLHALEAMGLVDEDTADLDDDVHHIEDVYLATGGEFLVGEIDGAIVAMAALKPTSAGRAELKRMRVHPAYQRRGLGQEILEALEMRARESGFRTIHLDTTVQQEPAQALYLKNGYRETRRGRIRRFDIIFYEKDLA
jgi:ribosomal protein S18 acetylase RimI-like enzyme